MNKEKTRKEKKRDGKDDIINKDCEQSGGNTS
jgi:hypothetical protein